MSTAPRDKTIRVKITNVSASGLDEQYRRWNQEAGLAAKYEHGLWKVEDYFLMIDKSFVGWRPL